MRLLDGIGKAFAALVIVFSRLALVGLATLTRFLAPPSDIPPAIEIAKRQAVETP